MNCADGAALGAADARLRLLFGPPLLTASAAAMSKVEDEADAFDNKKRLWVTTSEDTFAMALIVSNKGDQVTVKIEATQEVCRPPGARKSHKIS